MKKTAKKLLSMALVLVMVLSLLPAVTVPAAAEGTSSGTKLTNEYGFQITVPDNFERDTAIPYGSGTGPVNLSPVKEIGVFESSATTWHSRVYNFTEQTMVGTDPNKNLFSSSSKSWIQDNIVFPAQSHFFHPSTAMTTQVNASASSPLGSASGTSLDPGGDGRDNVLAYYGRNRTSGQLQLYIYQADRANHDTVTGAAWTGSAESSYSWMSETTPYNNEGYLSIVSGDFDGDGKDTLVLYDPAAGNIQLREFKVTDEINGRASQVVSYALGSRPWLAGKFGLTPNQIQKMSGGTAKARNTAMVQLAAGDIDGDQKDELIVTLSLPNMVDESSGVNYIANRSSVLMVLDKNPTDKYFTCNWVQQLAYVYDPIKENTVGDSGCWWMRAASSVVGDVDGDGKAEILTVGVGSNDNGDDDDFFRDGYFAVITEYNGGYSTGTSDNTTLKELSTKGYYIPRKTDGENVDFVGTASGDVNCMSPVSLGLVRFDGTGTQPYALIRGLIYKFDTETNDHRGGFVAANTTDGDKMFNSRTIIRQPIVGNFDGNMEGREQTFFVISSKIDTIYSVEIGGWYYDGKDGNKVMDGTGLRSSRWQAMASNASEVVLTAPDADTNDGYIAKFKDKEYTYVDPEIMAILEAAPYFEDLKDEYRETLGGTTFSTGKGSGSGNNVQGATRAGAYVSYEQDISIFGIKIGSWEASSEFALEWSWEKSTEQTWTYEMEFDGGRDSNQVVLICTPVTVYHYDVYDVADGKWKPMDVTIADKPVYAMLSVEEYNAIAELRGDPTIGSDIVCAVAGQPDTYRTSTSGLKNVYAMNQLMDVGHGSSTKTQAITKDTTHTFSDNLVHSIDVSAGMGAGGFKVGVTGGFSIGGGWSTTDTSSMTRSGTVGEVPDGYEDYSFNWKFITWDATFGEGNQKYTVPVLGYVVTDVRQPPSMPQNVEADPGTDSVTLTWEPGFKSAVYYEVCRYVPNDPTGKCYYVRGTVNGSEAVDGVYTFTDTGLEPGTQYQYTLRAVGFLGSTTGLLYSNYIEPIAVVTASTAGTPRIVSQTNGVVSILPNTSTTFEVVALPAISTNSLSFQWQSRGAGENAWKNMTNKVDHKLTVTGTAAMDGTSYRCMVAELTSGTIPVFIYSEPVTLKVGKADSTAVLDVLNSSNEATTSGSADHSEETPGTPYQKTVANSYEITVGNSDTATVYEAYAAGENTSVYRNVANGKYYQLTGLSEFTPKTGEAGVYTGTADSDIELTALAGYLANGSTITTNINDLSASTMQKTVAIDGVTYNECTATGVAVQGENPVLQQSTLTLYQKADGSTYYAYYETKTDGTNELKLQLLTAIDGEAYPEGNLTNFTYLLGTLEPSLTTEIKTITIDGVDKACEVYTYGSSVNIYKYTKYKDIEVPVFDDQGNLYNETITVVDSETYYYETTTGEDESAVTTHNALTSFAQGQYGVITDNTVSGIVTIGNVQTTTVDVPTTEMTTVPGDEVTLSVNISATGTTPSGNVSFQITNTTTGLTTTRTATLSGGTASVTWTPSTEGVYTIRAVYGGSSTAAAAASNTITYYATAGEKMLYDIPLSAAPQYGDTIAPRLYKGTTAGNMQPVTGATFTYHKYLGTGVIGTDSRGYETTGTTIPEGGISSLLPGAYIIKASITNGSESEVVASKSLTVSKRAITVTVPNFTVNAEEVSSINWAEKLKTIQVTNSKGTPCTLIGDYGDSTAGYPSLFTLTQSLTASAGNYDVGVGYTETYQSDFLSKYMPTIKRGVATVTTDYYTVTYSAGANGGLTANNISDGSKGFATGASIKKNSTLLFTATPDAGFQVSKWTVKNAAGTVLTTGFTTGTNTLTLNALGCDLIVTVEFSNETHQVTFGAADSNTGTVTATQFGTALVSGNTVVGGSSVTFTATPASGYVIKQWGVAKGSGTAEVQLNPDNTTAYTGTTLTLDNIDADTAVSVTFESAGSPLQVTYSAVKDESGSLVAANDVVSFTADGLTDGEAVKGSTVVLTATVTPGTAILEWQVSTNGTDWTTVAGSVKEYTIYSLQAVTQIRVLVTTSAASYPVTFSIDGGDAASQLTATYNGGAIASGAECMAYTSVVFTYTESENYEFVRWDVTGTTGAEATDASNRKVHTYTIDSLDANTTVKAVVQKKPQISITQPDNGTITVTGTIEGVANQTIESGKWVDCGTDITVTLEPNTGYEVADTIEAAYTDGTGATTDDKTYTISNVQTNQTITAAWSAIQQYSVTYSVVDTGSGPNGTLTAAVSRKGLDAYKVDSFGTGGEVYRDSTVTFTANPASGYRVMEWKVDGDVYQPDNTPYIGTTLTLSDLAAAKTVTVQFMEVGSKVTIAPGANGSITSAMVGGVEQVNNITSGFTLSQGAAVAITARPEVGYEVAFWTVNGVEQPNSSSNTFTYTAQTEGAGAVITVTFRQVEYSVTWGGANGTVTAAGYEGSSANIRGGETVTFTAVPADGYEIAGWTVNGVTQSETGSTFTWTVPNGQAEAEPVSSYTVKAIFGRGKFTVTVTQPANGTITSDAADLSAVTGNTAVTFTAAPAEGYIVIGWTVDGVTTDTRSLTHTVTVTKAITVTAVLVPSHYAVSCAAGGETTGGTVTLSGSEATSASVAYGESITFTAVPKPYFHVSGWMVDDVAVPNTANQNTFTLSNVTGAHTVTVVFEGAIRYAVRYEAKENGTLSATNNGTPLTLTPDQTANVWGGSKLVFTATPATGAANYMVAHWTVNGTDVTRDNMAQLGVTLDHYLSNTLTIENLSEAMTIQVSFESYTGYTIPTGDTGYTVTGVERNPNDTTPETEIRENGNVRFIISPDSANEYSTISSIKLGDTELLTGEPNDNITVVKNSNGSYTVTITGVQFALALTVTAHKLVITSGLAGYNPPAALENQGLDTPDKIQAKLETKLTASADGKVFYDIALKYKDGDSWVEVTEANFPANGVYVVLPYPDGTNSNDNFTIIHMLTTGDHAGNMETISYTKETDGLHFRVNSLSPFAVSWTKYTAPSGGVGGGGGGAAAPAETIVIKDSVNGKVTVDNTCAEEGDTVTLTVTPDKGYTLETLTVTDGSGKEVKLTEKDGKYTFTMPASDVTIKATFMEDNSMLNFFVDVPADAYYYDAVLWAAKEGITGGVDATHFAPYATCTRAQAVTFLWRAAGSPAPENSAMPFTDVAEGSYYHDAVLWAVENGITKGTTDTTFSPNAKCTRAQIVTFLYRSVQAQGGGMQGAWMFQNPFTDVSLDSYYGEAVMWAVANGVTGGTTATTFSPNSNCTRAQIVTFLYRSKE